MFEIGTTVRVKPQVHREGEQGTVVRHHSGSHHPEYPEMNVAVAFAGYSLPLWYAPEELEVVTDVR